MTIAFVRAYSLAQAREVIGIYELLQQVEGASE